MRMRRLALVAFVATASLLPFEHPAYPAERPFADRGEAIAQPKKKTNDDKTQATSAPPRTEQPRPAIDEEARKQTRENIEINRKLAEYTGDLVRLNRWLVGATFISAFLLFASAAVQAWIARDTEKRQLRTYVAGVPKFIFSFDTDSLPRIRFEIKNIGRTPALRMQHRTEINTLPHPYKAGMRLDAPSGEFSPPMVLFPNTEFFGTKMRAKAFTADEIAAIRDENARIYVYGEIRYVDVFGKQRTTTFCWGVIADAGTRQKLTSSYVPADLSITFEIAPMGNSAT